jgi:2'-5' RNA ligase
MVETIRSFIAIELSPGAQTALAKLQTRLKAIVPPQTVRWTAPANIHVTLHFLGEVELNKIEAVSQLLHVSGSTYAPFTLTLGGLGCFPNTRRPRIIWTGVQGQTEILSKLYQDLGQRLKVIGYTPEARPYSPHLTIGRVKDGLPSPQLARLGEVLEREQAAIGEFATLRVTEIALMKSDLKPAGPSYTQLARADLRESTD